MAATTITRESMTDNVTVWNVARIGSSIYDRIDSLIGAALTLGGVLTVEGFGTHAFSTGNTGGNILGIRNTSAGTGNYGRLQVGNNTTASGIMFSAYASTHATAPSQAYIESSLTGALVVGTNSTSNAAVQWMTSGIVRGQIAAGGQFSFGSGSPDVNYLTRISGTHTSATGTAAALLIDASVSPAVNQIGVGAWVAPTIVEAASGTHAFLAGMFVQAPVITAGAATVTTAASVYIEAAPAASGAANYALYVAGGQSVMPDGTAANPTLCGLSSGGASGIYWSNSGSRVNIATQGVQIAEFAGSSVSAHTLTMVASANGTGNTGNYISLGRNTSGAGSAGLIVFGLLGGGFRSVWSSNAGDLMINATAPTEAGGDTTGTVVGTQTSTRASKRDIARYDDLDGALRLINHTPLYRFRYRETGDADTAHVGILADESPAFTRYGGTAFDPINAFGYTAAAVQALTRRLERLEARG